MTIDCTSCRGVWEACYQLCMYTCKGTYACVRPHRYTYGNYRNTVANVDASDSMCRCIGKIIARDLRLVASRLYRMAVTRPWSRAAVTLTLSLGADLLGCINHTREKKRKALNKSCRVRTRTNSKVPIPISTAHGDLSADPAHGENPPPID